MALPDLIPPEDLRLVSWRPGWTLDGPIPDACSSSSHQHFPDQLFEPDGHLPILLYHTLYYPYPCHGLLLALVLLSPRWYYYPKVGLGRLIDG